MKIAFYSIFYKFFALQGTMELSISLSEIYRFDLLTPFYPHPSLSLPLWKATTIISAGMLPAEIDRKLSSDQGRSRDEIYIISRVHAVAETSICRTLDTILVSLYSKRQRVMPE